MMSRYSCCGFPCFIFLCAITKTCFQAAVAQRIVLITDTDCNLQFNFVWILTLAATDLNMHHVLYCILLGTICIFDFSFGIFYDAKAVNYALRSWFSITKHFICYSKYKLGFIMFTTSKQVLKQWRAVKQIFV